MYWHILSLLGEGGGGGGGETVEPDAPPLRDWAHNVVNLTRRIPRKTEIPLIFSTDRSTNEAITIIRSKMFQPLWKYSLDNASNLSAASAVKNVVKTLLPEKESKVGSSMCIGAGTFLK